MPGNTDELAGGGMGVRECKFRCLHLDAVNVDYVNIDAAVAVTAVRVAVAVLIYINNVFGGTCDFKHFERWRVNGCFYHQPKVEKLVFRLETPRFALYHRGAIDFGLWRFYTESNGKQGDRLLDLSIAVAYVAANVQLDDHISRLYATLLFLRSIPQGRPP